MFSGYLRIAVIAFFFASVFTVTTVKAEDDALVEPKRISKEHALKEARRAASAITDKATALITPLVKKNDLMKAMEVCVFLVPEALERYSKVTGYAFKRVSLTPRNPDNAADHYEKMIMKRMTELAEEGKLVESDEDQRVVHENDQKYLKYIRPILARKSCLKCHGTEEETDKRVQRFVKKFYPQDRSINLSEGALIGAISMSITLK